MRKLAILFGAEAWRAWLEEVRYPLQFVMGLVFMGLIFFLLKGVAQLSGVSSSNPETIFRLLVGYLLGLLAMSALSGIAAQISREAKSGTLENMVLSGHGLTAFFVTQALARLAPILLNTVILFLVLTNHNKINFSLSWEMLPAIGLFYIAALGLGLVVGAVALLFKEIRTFFMLAQLLVFPAVIANLPQLEWFPLVLGASVIRDLLQGSAVEAYWWILLLAETTAVFCGGVLLFELADREARKRGLLGHE